MVPASTGLKQGGGGHQNMAILNRPVSIDTKFARSAIAGFVWTTQVNNGVIGETIKYSFNRL